MKTAFRISTFVSDRAAEDPLVNGVKSESNPFKERVGSFRALLIKYIKYLFGIEYRENRKVVNKLKENHSIFNSYLLDT